jgi:hypothetical protein
MASQQGGKQKFFIIGGLIAVVGVVGYLASSYPPDSADTSGTIAPVKRYSADQGQSATIAGGDQSGEQSDAGDANDAADSRDAKDASDSADSRDAKDASDSADSRDAKDASDSADSRDARDASDAADSR